MTEATKQAVNEDVEQALGEFARRVVEGERTADLFGVDDNFIYAVLQRAYQFYSNKNFDKASALLKGVTVLDNRHPYAHLLLGDVLLQQNCFEEAATALERAKELDPDEPKTLAKLGEAYVRLQRFDESIEVLESAIEGLADDSQHAKRASALLEVATSAGQGSKG